MPEELKNKAEELVKSEHILTSNVQKEAKKEENKYKCESCQFQSKTFVPFKRHTRDDHPERYYLFLAQNN